MYEYFFMLNSIEYENSTAHVNKNSDAYISSFKLAKPAFILLINIKNVCILTFMNKINYIFSWVEQERSFISLVPGLILKNCKMECDSLLMTKRFIWSVFVYIGNGHKVCVIPQNLADSYEKSSNGISRQLRLYLHSL